MNALYPALCPTGYLLVSGFVSLAVCYRLGPVTSRRTLNAATWTLQAVGVVLACHGVTYAPVSWILLAVLLGLKILPLLFALFLAIWRCSLFHSFITSLLCAYIHPSLFLSPSPSLIYHIFRDCRDPFPNLSPNLEECKGFFFFWYSENLTSLAVCLTLFFCLCFSFFLFFFVKVCTCIFV